MGFFNATGYFSLKKVIAQDESTAKLGIKLLLIALVCPVLLGWVLRQGYWQGLYSIEFELALTVLMNFLLLTAVLLFRVPKFSQSQMDLHAAQENLRQMNLNLEKKVAERTLEVKKQQQMLVHSLKMKSLGEMAGGIAHEINTPLGSICLRASQLKNHIRKNFLHKAAEEAKIIESTAMHIAQIIRGLMAFAKEGKNDPFHMVCLHSLIYDILPLCQEKFKSKGVDIRIAEVPKDLYIECQSIQVSQAIFNILKNAYHAVENLKIKWVEIKVSEQKNAISIIITDSGHGIPTELKERIMEPFFTTKEIGKGMGLGLSISKGIIETQNGFLKYNSNSPHTQFIISLPKTQPIQVQEIEAV